MMLRIVSTVLALCLALANGSVLETARQNGCGKLVDLVTNAGLRQALEDANDITLFAPNDAAIEAIPPAVLTILTNNKTLLQEVLKFHVVTGVRQASSLVNDGLLPTLAGSSMLRTNIYKNGQVVTAEGSVVSNPNQRASNGIVHVIDKVIYPVPDQDIPTYVSFNQDLKDLAYMVFTARLVDALSAQSFTLFAPSNQAVQKLSPQRYSDLLSNITELTDVLTFHVVKGTVYSSGLSATQMVPTLEGKELEIKADSAGVTVNGARVTMADISTTNGVIHVIDTVLIPPAAAPSKRFFLG